jgi:hypothetical protein
LVANSVNTWNYLTTKESALNTSVNFNVIGLFSSDINWDKMVKINNNFYKTFSYTSSNKWWDLEKDRTLSDITAFWYIWWYTIDHQLIPSFNHGSKCSTLWLSALMNNSSSSISWYSKWNQFMQQSCNSNYHWSDNISWQVFTK